MYLNINYKYKFKFFNRNLTAAVKQNPYICEPLNQET
jgi:hypothetical protein